MKQTRSPLDVSIRVFEYFEKHAAHDAANRTFTTLQGVHSTCRRAGGAGRGNAEQYEIQGKEHAKTDHLDIGSEITMITPTMATADRIVIDPAIAQGKPIIRGTRIPVTMVVGSLAGGMSFEDVQREYDLSADDIRAALKFVGELAEQESFHRLPAA
jgi:uncharacterized protein (DUF433 family)